MNKTFAVITTILFIGMLGTIGCQEDSTKKLENAKAAAAEAQEKLDEANEEYLADRKSFRQEIEILIAANEQSIEELKAKIASSKKEAKADYKMAVEELEQKNAEMENKLDAYQLTGKEQWDAFKVEFKRNMSELETAIKNLTVDNAK